MSTLHRSVLSVAIAAASSTLMADQLPKLEEITIIGSKEAARQVAGSAYVLSQEEMELFSYTDINRMLTAAPGVYVREEEGYGLRPNIGIRGSGTGRSAKVTVMEDGVLVAPNPYANPAAYYFPTSGRMSGIEVLKGTPALQYGPATVGGAINMITTAIPAELGGKVTAEVGEDGEKRLFANIGDGGNDTFGWLLETHQQQGDGFKDIDRSSTDAGLKKEDYVAKFRLQSEPGADMPQRLDLKLSYATEESNMSYLGLSEADFDADPDRRYGLTEQDQMQNRHVGASLKHLITLSEGLDLRTTVYYNKFHRDWFKVDKINGSSQSTLINNANSGDATAIGILNGTIDAPIAIKHNNRDYLSQGIQTALNFEGELAGFAHQLNTGVRLHEEEMDRVQPTETWQQVNGQLQYDSETPVHTLTGSNNRFEKGDAFSFWMVDQIALTDRLDLTVALRYENWEKNQADKQSDGSETKRQDKGQEWLPGIAFTYQLNDAWQLLGGVHKGIAPSDFTDGESPEPEKSINYEAGVRFADAGLDGELIAFYSDYSNTVQNCSAQRPCADGSETGSVQLGESEVTGVEAAIGYTFQGDNLRFPVRATYTYTKAEITKNPDGEFDKKGGLLAYIPENQLNLSVGVEGNVWDAFLNARYTDQSCTTDACNNVADNHLLKTDALWVLDAVSHYQLNDQTKVYLKVDNLLDDRKVVSRSPYGARANKPRTAMVGVTYTF